MTGNGAGAGLRLHGVRRVFRATGGDVAVLRGVDLEVPGGTLAVVTGPSGAGKSTLLHLAALLDRPDAGRVWIDGIEASCLGERERSALRRDATGVVFQRFHLLPDRSALENVRFRFRYTDVPRVEAMARARAALDAVGLGAVGDRPARLLSGGEMQRVALARALAYRPRVLLADEPVGQVDAAAADVILAQLERLRAEGVAILAAAHGPVLGRHADRVYALEDGRLTVVSEGVH